VISDKRYLKYLHCLSCSETEKAKSYTYTCELFFEITRDKPDPAKIIAIEEAYLWPILSKLDSPGSKFYEDETNEFKHGFIELILEEIKLRQNKQAIGQKNYENELLLLISARIPYYCELLHIKAEDVADFRKNSKKWWLALASAGAVTIMGVYGIRKILGNKSKNKNEPKKTT
jgi:hypothetical protein